MKVTNTDHTAINDNHSKCRMNQNSYQKAEEQNGRAACAAQTSTRVAVAR